MVLSDAGFDVWVGNYRCSSVSPHVHTSLDADSAAFWNYSWHEMGLHDLAAMVDVVLARTGQRDLQYIGHSMGSTGMLVLLSSRPEYNAKIRLASFLAPVAYVSTLRSRLFRSLFSIAPQIKVSSNLKNTSKWFGMTSNTEKLTHFGRCCRTSWCRRARGTCCRAARACTASSTPCARCPA